MTVASRRADGSRVSIDVVARAIIVFLTISAPAFIVDDAAIFNYLNNVEDARPLYYYTGYVHLIPQVVSYLLSPLPLVAQAVLYRVVPLLMALLLYREATRLFSVHGHASEARLLALALILVLRVIDVFVWANLTYSMWTVFLVATLYVIRVGFTGGRYSPVAIAGLLVAGLAFPLGGLLAGLFLLHAVIGAERHRRLQNASLAVAIVIGQVWLSSGSPDPRWNTDLAGAPSLFITGFRERKLHTLITLASLGVLAAAMGWAWRRAQAGGREFTAIASFGYIGWASMVLYVLSNRFERYAGGVEPRYAVPAACCALAAVGWIVLARQVEPARSLQVGAYAGVGVAVIVVSLYSTLRGPLELALMKYQFVMASSAARAHCQAGDVFVFEDDESSPVLFCRPRVLPPGDFPLVDFVPTVGGYKADDPIEAKPFILSPKPLFP